MKCYKCGVGNSSSFTPIDPPGEDRRWECNQCRTGEEEKGHLYASAEDQLTDWLAGNPKHNKTRCECCPDFSCCQPGLLWPYEKRMEFCEADDEKRHTMLMGSLSAMFDYEEIRKVHLVT